MLHTGAALQGGGGILRQIKFVVVNFAVGNFAKTPGFRVVNFADTHRKAPSLWTVSLY